MSGPTRVRFPFGVCSVYLTRWTFPDSASAEDRANVEACDRIYPAPPIPLLAADLHMAEAAAYELGGEILPDTD